MYVYVSLSLSLYNIHIYNVYVSWVTRFSGKTVYREMRRFAGWEKATAIWSFRHCEPAACILGLTGICGFPWCYKRFLTKWSL